ncbi:hypothetical protein CY34DRAFT_538844 [Suillus luteus UH-Slu-Lm8-n1]|uniref:Uncharacterized protein n=1 Tax=Suillus luteus UH-Slu-Lm8-n1 TaxID=930992 RepID=A0A0D0AW84_9AGAM|nr:hypothetical protein CY34DRAFT_538844 [Suillus luteus UH-Slu-Lm8-n1]
MSNRRSQADIDQSQSAIQPSGSSDHLQDNSTRGHSSSASFHQSTSPPTPTTATADQQWFPNSHQMIVTSSSFYDPAQATPFTPQPPMNVWDTQYTPPPTDFFPRQHPTSYQQPYPFEPPPTTQYSFVQDNQRPVMPTSRRSARGSSRPSGYYRQGGAQSHQYPQVAPSNTPSTQPQPPTGQALAAQRTTQLIAGQFPPVQNEQQYPSQPQYSPPPTQSQFQIQTQFTSTAQFSQSQSQAQGRGQGKGQNQFGQPSQAQVQAQSHGSTQSQSQSHGAQSQPQTQVHAHAPPNQPQSQHYPPPSDSYYMQSDMYYAMNAQGSQSAPSLHSQAQSATSLVGVFIASFGACLFVSWKSFSLRSFLGARPFILRGTRCA